MRIFFVCGILACIGFSFSHEANALVYQLNTKESTLNWSATKKFGQHNGTINLQSGSFDWENNTIKSGNFEIDMNSIIVLDVKDKEKNTDLTKHLKSEDFFSAKKFPVGKFVLEKLEKLKDNDYVANGTLTIKNIAKPEKLQLSIKPESNKLKISGKATLDRTKWDIRYRSGKFFPQIGDKLIHDDFTVSFDLIATQSDTVNSTASKQKKKSEKH